jgi:hypothetical protein
MMHPWRLATPAALGLIAIACGGSAPRPAAPAPAAATNAPTNAAPMSGKPTIAAPSQTNKELHDELLLRVASDQAARQVFVLKQRTTGTLDSADVARLSAVDTANTSWLKGVIARQGWPTRAQVGPDGVRAALLLVQHADLDTAFQARTLPLVQKSFEAGELPGGDVAMLTDRVAVNHGRPQIYGTQAKMVNGRMVAATIAESSAVDVRRARMGLPPLRDYFRILDSLYSAPR